MTMSFLVADLFCGAGGSSTGAKKAIEEIGGQMELVAINHWNTAIATHQANHPPARHLVEDVSLVDPEAVVEEGRLDLLMASPECKFYSRARGGKPIHDQGRMNPWAVHNWLTKLDVRCVIIENVPEFVDWGPLTRDGRPDKARRGEHFQAWFLTFHALGYHAEWRMLNAADYGDATTRVRFFLMARRDGNPVVWPEPSHAKGDTGMFPGRRPWRGAKEIIDWTSSGRSILDDPKYVNKPLSVNTRRRIARGLERFGGPLAPLYIRLLDLSVPEHPDAGEQTSRLGAFVLNRGGENGSSRCHPVEDPMPTATTRGAGYLVQPLVERFVAANRKNNAPKSMDEPIPTVTTAYGGGSFLVEANMKPFLLGQQSAGAPRLTDDPVPTVTGGGAISLVRPSIIQYYGASYAQAVDTPLSAITSNNKHALIKPTLVEYYGNSTAADIDEPLPTVTAKGRHGLVNPALIQVNHGNGSQGDRGNDRRAQSVDDPLPSITTSRGLGLAEPVLLDEVFAGEMADAGIDPRRLIVLDGQPYLLDMRFRMLQNSELARAMGFEDDDTKYEFIGNISEVTKQIGNAVPVRVAKALVKAALA